MPAWCPLRRSTSPGLRQISIQQALYCHEITKYTLTKVAFRPWPKAVLTRWDRASFRGGWTLVASSPLSYPGALLNVSITLKLKQRLRAGQTRVPKPRGPVSCLTLSLHYTLLY